MQRIEPIQLNQMGPHLYSSHDYYMKQKEQYCFKRNEQSYDFLVIYKFQIEILNQHSISEELCGFARTK